MTPDRTWPSAARGLHRPLVADLWAELAREYCPRSTWAARIDESGRREGRRYYEVLPWALLPRWLRGELMAVEKRRFTRERTWSRRLTMPEGERSP